jgi:hypothetical protein
MTASTRRRAERTLGPAAILAIAAGAKPTIGGSVHQHNHEHTGNPGEPDAGRPHSQHVVLEIGDDVGALIVYTEDDLLATEVEISPAESDAERSHKQVLERTAGGRTTFSLVYDNLSEGSYTLWIDNTPCVREVHVSGGRVTELDFTQKTAGQRAPRALG